MLCSSVNCTDNKYKIVNGVLPQDRTFESLNILDINDEYTTTSELFDARLDMCCDKSTKMFELEDADDGEDKCRSIGCNWWCGLFGRQCITHDDQRPGENNYEVSKCCLIRTDYCTDNSVN